MQAVMSNPGSPTSKPNSQQILDHETSGLIQSLTVQSAEIVSELNLGSLFDSCEIRPLPRSSPYSTLRRTAEIASELIRLLCIQFRLHRTIISPARTSFLFDETMQAQR